MKDSATGDGLNEELAEAAFDTVREYCKRQGVTEEWVAKRLGYNPTTFSNYLNNNRPIPASLVPRVTRLCGFGFMGVLCGQADGVFFAVPKKKAFGKGEKAYRAALGFVETSGSAVKAFFKALEDGKLTADEHAVIKKWLDRLTEVLVVLRQAFDEMPITAAEDIDDERAA